MEEKPGWPPPAEGRDGFREGEGGGGLNEAGLTEVRWGRIV